MFRLLAVCFLMILSNPTMAFSCDDTPSFSTTKSDGTRIGLFISSEALADTTPWTPGEGQPPLSLTEAITIAEDEARRKYTKYDGARIDSVTLQKHGCSLSKDRWYYQVDLVPIFDGYELRGGGNWVVVLMNRKTIWPREY